GRSAGTAASVNAAPPPTPNPSPPLRGRRGAHRRCGCSCLKIEITRDATPARLLSSAKIKTRGNAMPLLENHIAVVTGAASGIGRAIAAGFAREGARVVLLDIDEKAVAEAAREIRHSGGKADSLALDVTRREDCIAVAKQIAGNIGQVSILVNNAGINR